MGRTVVLSLHSRFAAEIFQQRKRFEFRRVRVRIKSGDRTLIYESAPTSQITGEFMVGIVVSGSPKAVVVLEDNQENRRAARKYLKAARVASAIEVLTPRRWSKAKNLQDMFPRMKPPQSYTFA